MTIYYQISIFRSTVEREVSCQRCIVSGVDDQAEGIFPDKSIDLLEISDFIDRRIIHSTNLQEVRTIRAVLGVVEKIFDEVV